MYTCNTCNKHVMHVINMYTNLYFVEPLMSLSMPAYTSPSVVLAVAFGGSMPDQIKELIRLNVTFAFCITSHLYRFGGFSSSEAKTCVRLQYVNLGVKFNDSLKNLDFVESWHK